MWLRGEHDLATTAFLVAAIDHAAQRDDADVLVDLSEVTFMDASTIGVLVGSRNRLRTRAQSLHLRAPSPPARRILDLCGAAHLVHRDAAEPTRPTGAAAALGSWVDVPPSAPPDPPAVDEPAPETERQPARQRATTTDQPAKTGATIETHRRGQ